MAPKAPKTREIMEKSYFLTGATGFLGKTFLKCVLASEPHTHIYCLVRPKRFTSAAERIQKILMRLQCSEHTARVSVIAGDLAHPNFGLTQNEYDNLTHSITHIIHCAAKVDFVAPDAIMQRENILTTQHIISFAKKCQQNSGNFQCLGYVSTAYVAGKRKGLVLENDFTDQYGFKNAYEATKYSAEKYIRDTATSLPVIIFRPSIIIGDSHGMNVDKSNVLYPLIRVAQRHTLNFVPAKNASLDCVSVDFVANAMYVLLSNPHVIGKTLHLTAGEGNEISIDFVLQTMNKTLNLKLTRVPPWTYKLGKPFLAHLLNLGFIQVFEAYYPYLLANPTFCNVATQDFLRDNNLVYPAPQVILEKTIYHLSRLTEEQNV